MASLSLTWNLSPNAFSLYNRKTHQAFTLPQTHQAFTLPQTHQAFTLPQTQAKLFSFASQFRSSTSIASHDPLSLRFSFGNEAMKKKKNGRGFSAVCYAAPLSSHSLLWISTVCSAILMFAKGTAIQKAFLIPLFAIQAPSTVVAWIRGEYGIWTAFLALLFRAFFFIPAELEFPFLALLVVILAPHQAMNLRGTQEGAIVSLVISGYLAFQHFSRTGSLQKAFDQGSVVATLAILCIITVSLLLLI